MSSLTTFRNSLLEKAGANGYQQGQQHRLGMLHDNQGTLIYRQFVLGPQQPAWPLDADPVVWYSDQDGQFRKSSNWKSGTTWEPQTSVESLFIETTASGSDSGFNGGNTTVPVILIGPATDPDGATTLEQVQVLIDQGSSGAVNVGPSLQSLSELRALDVALFGDKHLRFVEDEILLYAYDLDSTTAVDGKWCVRPNVGPGRWKPTTLKIIDSGTF